MKITLTIVLGMVLAAQFAFAQNIDVKDINAKTDDSTTIEIRKGQKSTASDWEVHDGTADVEGDSAMFPKEARQNWKKACDVWKKEFREDNKENKIISIGCGTPSCVKGSNESTCTSKANYKIKTKVR